MNETTVIETPNFSKAKNGLASASRLDDTLHEAQLGLAKLTEFVEAAKAAAATAVESALAKRLEEDYGFKSVTASCFEGFRKQMSEIVAEPAPDSALAKRCVNTLTTIATPPGRIDDRDELAVSPTAEFKHVAEATTDLVKAAKK